MTVDAVSAAAFVVDGDADVVVLIVTYNSAGEIDQLLTSLRRDAEHLRLRVVVADNSSTDDTLARLQAHPDVIAVASGGNLGYAGGINVARAHAGPARAQLILNPDLRVRPGAVRALLAVFDAHPDTGIAAPMILDDSGAVAGSLFNEPTVWRAACDAVLGPLWRGRPAALSEWVRSATAYRTAHAVDWASGAALMVSAAATTAVGEWDERFFLYSEETDYCRRIRDAGFTVRYEPAAVVEHSQGKSGQSAELDALLNVSRIRYMRKHSPRSAGAYLRIAILGALLRARRSASHRETVAVLRNERRWAQLPHATWQGVTGEQAASVVVPAHDEAAVIVRTLRHLAPAAARGALDVRVVCNGCTDDTASRARAVEGVQVTEIATPSKIAALNAGDHAAHGWPRIYLDADVDLPSAAIPGLVRALSGEGILGGRPRFEYDLLDSSATVRAYYRARMRIPGMSRALWGAGVYALTYAGHGRVAPFPDVIADDVHVDRALSHAQKAFPATPPVTVRVPRTVRHLLPVLARARRGPSEQGIDRGRGTLLSLIRTIRGPVSASDAAVFVVLTFRARRIAAAGAGGRWERDDSSRSTR